jgi:hypothetical protein
LARQIRAGIIRQFRRFLKALGLKSYIRHSAAAGKSAFDYVTRRFNASSAELKKLVGLDLRWGYTPKWIISQYGSLTFSVDFWDIERAGLIGSVAPQVIVDEFVAGVPV